MSKESLRKSVKDFRNAENVEEKQNPNKTEKSQVNTNVHKIAINRFYDFDTTIQKLIALASVALGMSELLKDVLAYYFIDVASFDSTQNKMELHIKVVPFFKHLKEDLYKRSGLHPETVFVYTFLSHF
jgi:hypothetical protein